MLPENSPFSLSDEPLELPFVLNGSFDWLEETTAYDYHIGQEHGGVLLTQLDAAISSAAQHNLTLPQEFVNFIRNLELHRHLRSATDCYLSIAKSVLPLFGGYLLRFLADSQGAAFWYLFLNSDGSDHCVVSSYDPDRMDYEPEDIQKEDFTFEAESFEAFICRLWLGNELWFAEEESSSLPNVEPRFLELYNPYS